MARPQWSIIIPALDAEAALAALLPFLRETGGAGVELIVADGGSRDATIDAARHAGARVVRLPAGRGAQLAGGAAAAAGERLFFLHADTRPPRDWRRLLDAALSLRPRCAFAFSLSYAGGGPSAALVAAGANLRSRLFDEPYGDQGLALTAAAYRDCGGYAPLPLFEDADLARRLRARGGIATLNARVASSPQRLLRTGALANVLRNALLKFSWRRGADPEALWQRYTGRPAGRQALAVFAKPPVPGKVKTRLAASIGAAAAALAYRALALQTFAAARAFAQAGGAAYLYYDGEPDAWTAEQGLVVRRQASGGLGERLAAAHAELFGDGFARVATIGTDCPHVDVPRLEAAFQALRETAVVLGPAEDGGYWLVGQAVPEPGLFTGIEWSTPKVLAQSLERAAALDLTTRSLERLRDVDTAEDLWAWLGARP